jgi:hypothetical protein
MTNNANPFAESTPLQIRFDPKTQTAHAGELVLGRRLRCRDRWLELYFPFLEALHVRFGGGPIGQHYVDAASTAYAEFCWSCDPFFRRAAWKAIQAALQLFCQRRGSN